MQRINKNNDIYLNGLNRIRVTINNAYLQSKNTNGIWETWKRVKNPTMNIIPLE